MVISGCQDFRISEICKLKVGNMTLGHVGIGSLNWLLGGLAWWFGLVLFVHLARSTPEGVGGF